MAKRRKSKSAAVGRTTIVRAPAPIVRVSAPRAAVARRAPRRRRSSVGGGGGMSGVKSLVNPALAGGGVGLLVKSGMIEKLPAIPVIGRIGAAAIALKYFGGSSPMMNDMARGCAFLAGYQLTSTGTIQGDDDEAAFVTPVDDGYADDE
jgi:hypothetical protein